MSSMDRHAAVSRVLPSSPPDAASSPALPSLGLLSPTRTARSMEKEKRNPSVTPRRFGRFFTPRSSLPLDGRRILGVLDAAAVNRQYVSPNSLANDPLGSDPVCSSPSERLGGGSGAEPRKRRWQGHVDPVIKRRGVLADDAPMPQLDLPKPQCRVSWADEVPTSNGVVEVLSSPDILADRRRATLNHFFKASRGRGLASKEGTPPSAADLVSQGSDGPLTLEGYRPRPIRKFANRGFEAQLLNREHGFSSHAGRQHLAFPACDPRAETASFYSRSSDLHHCTTYTGQGGSTIPFSLSSCHNAPVTAIGDEQGFVRLFNTTDVDSPAQSKVDVHVRAHDNAIMDLAFSEDDMRLATACGDRTGRILDVMTQTVAVELNNGHWDSLRQIAFQPGQANGHALATSDRAGRIQVWDLRCGSAPTSSFSSRGLFGVTQRDARLSPFAATTVNTMDSAHSRTVQGITSSASVTAIQWLPAGREHLLLSASEANACIKLWDTRYLKPRRQAEETPLAVTPEPQSHAWRSYGITSLALGSDAARLYAVCKDSTVYAYSTAHLVLGHAPELAPGAAKRRPGGVEGLGPLYGFRHDKFRAQSFYVKCAVRPARDGKPELLAVGSSDACAVLFPTDERYMRTAWAARSHALPEASGAALTPSQPLATPTPSQPLATPTPSAPAPPSSVPVFRAGVPLVRGHGREVTTLSWSHHGRLVTASDDYVVRQWQEDAGRARYLRQVGEFGGERHMAGWADVGADWDVEDDDEG